MDVPDSPASVEVRLTNRDILRGTLIEERSDGWLLDEESGRLIHLYPPEVDQIVPRNKTNSSEFE